MKDLLLKKEDMSGSQATIGVISAGPLSHGGP